MTKSPRFVLVGGSASWSREEMRDAIRQVRRAERELELVGETTSGSPTEVLIAEMLEHLLDETEGGVRQ